MDENPLCADARCKHPRENHVADVGECRDLYCPCVAFVGPCAVLVEGVKYDGDKLDWTLVPWDGLEPVVRVLMFGAKKYARDNWRKVPGRRARYAAAMLRHVIAFARGEANDPESGESHIAHAACCALFILAEEPKT